MQNIAILIPTLKKGGAEKQAALLARALKSTCKVTIIVPFPKSGIEPENISLTGLAAENIITLKGSTFSKLREIYHILKKRQINSLFCYLTWPDFWGPIIGRLAGVNSIYQGLRNAKIPVFKLLLEFIGNQFSTQAIINNYQGEKVFRKYGIRNRIVIPNCYLNPNQARIRQESDTVTIITVGRFVSQKDYPTAIASVASAMKDNNNLRFKIIGHGELEDDVRNLVNQYGIADKTEILINPPGIMHHLMAADIYLSTSLFEGTSNSIMEALDASLPVIATDVGDNKYLVHNGINGYITRTRDTTEISGKIIDLLFDSELRNKMGLEGNRILREEFSFEKFKGRYTELINHRLK